MADSLNVHFLSPVGMRFGGAGLVTSPGGAMFEEGEPAIMWGQGTPDGNLPPFDLVNKGSLYLEVNATDDVSHVWQKVDEGGESGLPDWVQLMVDEDEGGSVFVVTSALVDISASDSEQVVFHAVPACTILEAGLVWNEATGASGAAEGDITIGTATGGAEIVAATSYTVSLASGAYTALTLVSGALAAGEEVFASHDVAAGAAGTYFLQLKIRIDT